MITQTTLTNFGPLTNLAWKGLGSINLVIGGNGAGKTFLLKALYSAMRTMEEHQRGDVPFTAAEILGPKLHWTFQEDDVSKLVSRGADAALRFEMTFNEHDFNFTLERLAEPRLTVVNNAPPRSSNSIFLPAKEILSLHSIILKSRDNDQVFGFDDTYYDLARALLQQGTSGNQIKEFMQSRSDLKELIGGKVHYEPGKTRWNFNEGEDWFTMGVTAEGVKKIAILETLLSNRYLDTQSIVFIDELESALHPTAISKTLDIISRLAERGLQFFIASHSYFVVKKLFLIAQEKGMSIPVISANADGWAAADLKDGMPDNPIISESVRLYEEQVNLALK
ncbi:MAG: AAA family ATPase [Verrucomicrobiaceae bacterium]|nr:AAA family ATPase [Verrucomicrobiaceae bacterium]